MINRKYTSPWLLVAMCVASIGFDNMRINQEEPPKDVIMMPPPEEYAESHRALSTTTDESPAEKKAKEQMILPNITLYEDVCPEEFPALFANVHDKRGWAVEHYRKEVSLQISAWNHVGDPSVQRGDIRRTYAPDMPHLVLLDKRPRFAIWSTAKRDIEYSAWNEDAAYFARGLNWIDPKERQANMEKKEPIVIEDGGHYVGFGTWFHGNFGHFVHDHLPTIALLKYHTPADSKFLLIDTKVTRNILKQLDPEFVENRVVWIDYDQVVQIEKGVLTVALTRAVPIVGGCCRQYDYLRQWVVENHFEHYNQVRQAPQEDRVVIFYHREQNSDTHHGRVLDPKHEEQILAHIHDAMKKYGRKEELVIFTGRDNGKTMTIEKQFELFSRASTIIGPHGSGLGGNLVWSNPLTSGCNDRIKLIEFIPGKDSAIVQAQYASYFLQWRKWPIDWHTVLYTKESSLQTTYIDLPAFDEALDAVWGSSSSSSSPLVSSEDETDIVVG